MADGGPRSRPRRIKGVLFDLDGTFADTAPDLAYALNSVLEARCRDAKAYEEIRAAVSHGGTALIRLGFGLEPGHGEFEELRRELLDVYRNNICRETRLFPGMEDLIQALEEHKVAWGIVTNKPSWLTNPLVAELGVADRACCVISGDSTPNSKPHPQPILHACNMIGLAPYQCVYVGDAERDMVAGRQAGTATLVALFGYIGPEDDPRGWGADGAVEHPLEIIDWLHTAI